MKLKKLFVIILTAILILPTFGCVMLEDVEDSSNIDLNRLPDANEELTNLRNEMFLNQENRTPKIDEDWGEEFETRRNLINRYFTKNYSQDKKFYFFINDPTRYDACDVNSIYIVEYYSNIANKDAIYYYSPETHNKFYCLFSYAYDEFCDSFSYVVEEIEGYQYNLSVSVMANEEVVAKLFANCNQNGFDENFIINMVKELGFQAQINDKKNHTPYIHRMQFFKYRSNHISSYSSKSFDALEDFTSFKNEYLSSESNASQSYYFFLNRDEIEDFPLNGSITFMYNDLSPDYEETFIELGERNPKLHRHPLYWLYSFAYEEPYSDLEFVTTVLMPDEDPQFEKLITIYSGDEIIAKFYYNVTDYTSDEFFLNLLKTYGYQVQIKN